MFHCYWRIPGVRKYAIQLEIDPRLWLIGLTFGEINTVCVLAGPFALTLLRRCDCCP